MRPKISLVVCVYNMPRELPRTIRSLSPPMQHDVHLSDYEIIIVDNGSTRPFNENECRQWGTELQVIRIPPLSALKSPVQAINHGISQARGELVGVMIDGARLASPGLLKFAEKSDRLAHRAITLTLGFHIGPAVQMQSVRRGYDQEEEDRLLKQSGWMDDGYRLFDVSVFSGSSASGWFGPMPESNAIIMRKPLWDELGGFDERFQTPGGGLTNLDLLTRAVALPEAQIITLLGEGTFHQIHGGVATNAKHNPWDSFHAEYMTIRGRAYTMPIYQSFYFGSIPVNALGSIYSSAETALTLQSTSKLG